MGHERRTVHHDKAWAAVETYLSSVHAASHLISAYSPGGLDPLEPHVETDEPPTAD